MKRQERTLLSRTALAGAVLLLLSACGKAAEVSRSSSGNSKTAATAVPQTLTNVKAGPREDNPSALEDAKAKSFPKPLIDPKLILSGGPPPDGIPAIDEPKFVRVGDVDWLTDKAPVLALTVGDETRGYPVQVMTWHEIVNDTVGGVPVAVTYCPLCNSGVAFERRVADRVLSFGASGRLYADNLVMYDRQTESLWPQLTGKASVGTLTGTELQSIPMGAVAWSDFKQANPDAWVLSQDTGYDRPYGTNPYLGYDDPDSKLVFDLPTALDKRLTAKTRVVGIEVGKDQVAVSRGLIAQRRVLEIEVAGKPVVLLHRPGQASALDTANIADGADIGTVAAFDPNFKGHRLQFVTDPAGFRDRQTRSTWNVLGQAVNGKFKGSQLTPIESLDTFWFAWVTFHPETRLMK